MIITVTANAMVEHVFPLPALSPGRPHHPEQGWAFATGKGINGARALGDLGERVTAVAALGGDRGQEIAGLCEKDRFDLVVVPVSGENRVGFVTFHRGEVTTVYGPGPTLNDNDVEALVQTVRSLLPARMVVLAGSVTHPELYSRLASLPSPMVLDFIHPSFVDCLKRAEVLIAKPNRQECRLLLGEDDPVRAAEILTEHGARWAVVTDGAGPAIFRTRDRTYRVQPPRIDPVHPVGCGDALCAGLIHAMDRPPKEAIAFAMACGAHNASRPEIGNLDPKACESLASRIDPEPL
jgi:tagatose 6-phosphate kinase